ncbi:MAG: hypothetical protein MUP09_11755, partial [Thiovulaceae bacterium]|nr:hypothetical protein [Sulfurimonadaceae bacterium]
TEAKKLAHNIIENNRKDLHLLSLQTARLALLLNNTQKSNIFTNYAKECSDIEAFLNSYGLIINKLVKSIDLRSIYDLQYDEIYEITNTLKSSIYDMSIKKDPKKDIEKYNNYKEKAASIKSNIYEYAMNAYYQLSFSENISDILSGYRNRIDNMLPDLMPTSKDKLDSITKNLQSENQEDWSNAVHICRKLLQELADCLYPPSDIPLNINGRAIDIGTKKDTYKTRLKNYINDNSSSEKFRQITNSNMEYISERLDAIYEATNKGTHETISSLEEAKRYVIHTYLFIGDVLSLSE